MNCTMSQPNPDLNSASSQKAGLASKDTGVSPQFGGIVSTVRLLLAGVKDKNAIAV